MSQVQPINCEQSLQQNCSESSFAKCGDVFAEYLRIKKTAFAKELGIAASEIDNYWTYTPLQEYQMYEEWNQACEYNAYKLHQIALTLEDNLKFSEFTTRLKQESNGFTKYFVGLYPDKFYQTYRTRQLPDAPVVVPSEESENTFLNISKKNLLIIGAIGLGLGLGLFSK